MAARRPGTGEERSPRTTSRAGGRAPAAAFRLIALAVFAGGCVAWALTPLDKRSPEWWAGALFLVLSGLCLALLGRKSQSARSASRTALAGKQSAVTGPRTDDPEVLVPMLGALLAFKYQVINEWQLEKALAVQRKQGRHKQPLGTILVEMGLVTPAQLEQALSYQKEYEREKRARLLSATPQPPD